MGNLEREKMDKKNSRRDFLKNTATLVAGVLVARPINAFAYQCADTLNPTIPGAIDTYYLSECTGYGPFQDTVYELSDCATDLSPSMFQGLPPAIRHRLRNALARDPEALCEWLLDHLP
ncbi:twin-arginine translocation signal domain-containing protein [bacterium]|nr:twin-arginine translocation signal domain-containing protein [bacterium]